MEKEKRYERKKKKENKHHFYLDQKKITTRETKIQEFGFNLLIPRCLNEKPYSAIYRKIREVNAK